jgi:hypothetical protein
MDDDDGVAFGFPEEWVDFKKRNPGFVGVFPGLLGTIQRVFGRRETIRNQADRVIFHLGDVCEEDFMEILLLCGNGYGIGGMKLLRGLYERAVTLGYLVNNPAETESFLAFHAIQRGKHLHHARNIFDIDSQVRAELIRGVEEESRAAKPRFQETLCEKCGTRRDMPSWTKLSTEALARKANPPGTKEGIEQLYLPCYFEPTMHVHATMFSITRRLRATEGGAAFNPGPQRTEADLTIMGAHNVLLMVMEMQDRYFGLKLDDELEARRKDFLAAWTDRQFSETEGTSPGPSAASPSQ